jgi:hypothetical protein
MKKFIITESEKNRILSLHGSKLLNEQYNDNWKNSVSQLVDSINSKLPQGCPKFLFEQNVRDLEGGGKSIMAYIMVDFTGLGFKEQKGTLSMMNVLQQSPKLNNVITAVNISLYNLVGTTKVKQVPKTMDYATKKLTVNSTSPITTGDLFNIGKNVKQAPQKQLQLLGSVLMGQKSKNTQTGAVTDYSAIPTTMVQGLNQIKDTLHTFVKATA